MFNGLSQVHCMKLQKEEFISIQRIKFRLVPLQVLNVHDDQRKCDYVAVWAACQRYCSMRFMNRIIMPE